MSPVLVVHYHEIALKGDNREQFERQLIVQLRRVCADIVGVRVERMYGRILLRVAQADDRVRALARIARVCGVANAWLGYEVPCDPRSLSDDAVVIVRERLIGYPAATFAVRAKRADKRFPMHSMEIERVVGGAIHDATGLTVDLDHPELLVRVEIVDGAAFVLVERLEGPGGLPVGVSGRVVVLISSGFDSPVAAWRMMRRGCEVEFVHFHSYPYTSDASIQNVRAIVARLAAWQGSVTLVTVPLIAYQKAVMIGAPHSYRVLLYRRAMVRIAERIARTDGASALTTGENLGQVASQTLENIAAVEAAATMPILRPLIGYDKTEIIAEAERIGTAEISRRPYDDCCSLFTPAHPATRSHADDLARMEAELGDAAYIVHAIAEAERTIIVPEPTAVVH